MIAATKVTLEECAICEQTVEFGPRLYEGAPLSGYDVFACYVCINTHRNGFGPEHSTKIIQLLDDAAICHPAKNEKGWFPLEF